MTKQDKPFVIVSHALPEAWLARLADRCDLLVGPETAVTTDLTPKLRGRLSEATAILTMLTVPVNAELLDLGPKLRVVSNMAVGVDNIDLAACTQRGIPVGHTPGVLTDGTADLTMALLLSAARRLPEAARDAREGRWDTWTPTSWLGADLSGATVGIVGMGAIGQAVARRARVFGTRIVYTSRRPKPEAESELAAVHLSLVDLLQQSDFVCLHVPLSPATHHLIDAEALHLMKETAVLVNVARGPVVDSVALETALREGWIAAAALDVTDPEPLPATHPLYDLPNCLIVPHIGSATHNTRKRMAELAGDNILAALDGQRLLHCANPEVYDAR